MSKKYLDLLKECAYIDRNPYANTINADTGGAPLWVIKKSQIHGEGVIANKSFNPGDLIDIAFIKIYNSGDFAKDFRITQFGSHLNHSYSPNAETNESYQTVATKKIEPGDEISVDYRIRTELEQPKEDWK